MYRCVMLSAVVLACSAVCAAAPAEVWFPPDSNYANVRTLGAAGDGRTDDTAVLKKAVAENNAVYLPPGTYLVSDTIVPQNFKRRFIQGAGPARTIIKLKDNCPGFGNADAPKAVFANWSEQIGKGANGQAFRNSFHDLTIDVGSGNPGAIGILYFTNNQGTIDNVVVRSSDPQRAGRAGIALAQCWPGPALLRHVRIEGFDDGIWSIIHQCSITLEHITLENQRRAGINNSRQMLFIRGLTSRQKNVPAIVAESGTLCVIDSDLAGSGPAAIDAKIGLYARNLRTAGYDAAIRSKDRTVPGPVVDEHAPTFTTLFETPTASLRLPVEESPTADFNNPDDWISVRACGAVGDGKTDDTAAIQKAIDSGKRVVYLPRAVYRIAGTIHVRSAVQRIHCMESNLVLGKGDAPAFRIEDGTAPFVLIEQFEGAYGDQRLAFEHASSRTLVLRHMIPRGRFYKAAVSGAKLFLDDVCAEPCEFGSSIVFARQLNPENLGTKVSIDGGRFWCLGLKTEKAGTAVEVKNGGAAEIIGGYIYYNRGTRMPDGTHPEAFVSIDSSISVVGASGAIKETRNGQTKTGSVKGLYVGRRQ